MNAGGEGEDGGRGGDGKGIQRGDSEEERADGMSGGPGSCDAREWNRGSRG
jgi:hypothetical protein